MKEGYVDISECWINSSGGVSIGGWGGIVIDDGSLGIEQDEGG